MKELQAIIEAFAELKRRGEQAALATVVDVRGSAYRHTGARMLITKAGRTVGTISGGCLERDVCERALEVMNTCAPVLVKYDTTSEADIVWGLGLGCNGVVRVLIEPLLNDREINLVGFIEECLQARKDGVIATVISVEGQSAARVGAHLMLHQNGIQESDIADAALEEAIIQDAGDAFGNSRSIVKTYELALGNAEVLIEAIEPPLPLLLFGAGYDAVPVARFAKELGWRVMVVDSRPAYATRERFPAVDELIVARPEAACHLLEKRTVAVVMTHNYLQDLELLRTLLSSPVRYLGVLGPRQRTERLLQDLRNEGVKITGEMREHLYSPIGIDIGADTPEEIALSIVAEIRAVLANRSGGLLRDRRSPIHNRRAEEQPSQSELSGEMIVISDVECSVLVPA